MTYTRTGRPAFIAGLFVVLVLGQSAPRVLAAPPSSAAPAAQPGEPQLSPAQEARKNARVTQFNKDITALRARLQNDKSLTMPQKQAAYQKQAKALAAQLDKDMLAILTPAQRAGVLKQRAAVAARAASAGTLARQLDASMTPAQRKQVSAINLAERAEVNKLVSDKTLTNQAKRQKFLTITQEAEAKRRALMTPTQKVRYDKVKAMMNGH